MTGQGMSMRLDPPSRRSTRTTLDREPEQIPVRLIRHTDRPARSVDSQTPIVLLKMRKYYYISDGNCRFAGLVDAGAEMADAWVLRPSDKTLLSEPMTAFLRDWKGGKCSMVDLRREAMRYHRKAVYR